MNIIGALKSEDTNLRISNGNKWLIYNSFRQEWIVYESKRYARVSQELISTQNEEIAIKKLLE